MESDPSVQFGKVISHPPPEEEVVVTGNLPLKNLIGNLNGGKLQEFRDVFQRPTISMPWWTLWKIRWNCLLRYLPHRNYRPDLGWWTTKPDLIMGFLVSTSKYFKKIVVQFFSSSSFLSVLLLGFLIVPKIQVCS